MTVKDLQEKLSKLDPSLVVLCYTEDEALQAAGHMFRILEIEGVSTTEGEWAKGADDVPSLKLGKGPGSRKLATIQVTSDF